MKCANCGVSASVKMLHRTTEKGSSSAGWTCIDCIEKLEPELAKNIKDDNYQDYQVLKDIESVVISLKP